MVLLPASRTTKPRVLLAGGDNGICRPAAFPTVRARSPMTPVLTSAPTMTHSPPTNGRLSHSTVPDSRSGRARKSGSAHTGTQEGDDRRRDVQRRVGEESSSEHRYQHHAGVRRKAASTNFHLRFVPGGMCPFDVPLTDTSSTPTTTCRGPGATPRRQPIRNRPTRLFRPARQFRPMREIRPGGEGVGRGSGDLPTGGEQCPPAHAYGSRFVEDGSIESGTIDCNRRWVHRC